MGNCEQLHTSDLNSTQKTDVVGVGKLSFFFPKSAVVVCVRNKRVQRVLTLFYGGVAQTCHDNRVVELKEQLGKEEEDEVFARRRNKGRNEIETKRTRHEHDRG